MSHAQLDQVFPYPVPEKFHPYSGLLVRPLGLRLEPELIHDLCVFLFDMMGCKFHDVEPATHEFSVGWDDPRKVDEMIPGGDLTSTWCPNLPPGLSLDPRTGHMHGTLEPGPWEWTVHTGPQMKFDAMGGTGSPYEDGQWIGWLENRFEPEPIHPTDVSQMTVEQKEQLLAALLQEKERGQ